MIELEDSDPYVSKNRVSSMTFTYPKTTTLFYGNYERKEIIHNLKYKLKSADKNMSHKTYVRGSMTDWECFKHDKDFSLFFTETMNKIKPFLFQKFKLESDLNVFDVWGNILKKGEMVEAHTHSAWHGILYLTEGNPLVFPEMRVNFTPKPGDWIISPPEIPHGVRQVETEQERMNIVFNFHIGDGFREVNNRHGTLD